MVYIYTLHVFDSKILFLCFMFRNLYGSLERIISFPFRSKGLQRLPFFNPMAHVQTSRRKAGS